MTETGKLFSLQLQAGALYQPFLLLKTTDMTTPAAPTPAYLKTLVDCLAKMRDDGFKEDYTVKEGKLLSLTTSKSYTAEEINIVNFFRFEGQTDPADDSIMYVIQTTDGSKGTLVDGYGPSSDADTSKFIVQVENMQKKAKT
jgi:hypothetical protein